MLRSRKMKFIELAVLKNDMNIVLEYLGKNALIQFSDKETIVDNSEVLHIRTIIDRLHENCVFIGLECDYKNLPGSAGSNPL